MQEQARKIDMFCTWTGLAINHTKSAVTGALFQTWKQEGTPKAKSDPRLHAQLHERIHILGHPVPYITPSTSYEYLGFHINMLLNWKEQFGALLKNVKTRGGIIARSCLTVTQKLSMMEETVVPLAHYSLNITPFNLLQIRTLDNALASTRKACQGLPIYHPNFAAQVGPEDGGCGTSTLMQTYVHSGIQNMVRAYNSPGRLGLITRSLLSSQLRAYATHCSVPLPYYRIPPSRGYGELPLFIGSLIFEYETWTTDIVLM
jgi:hypothetical protein